MRHKNFSIKESSNTKYNLQPLVLIAKFKNGLKLNQIVKVLLQYVNICKLLSNVFILKNKPYIVQ